MKFSNIALGAIFFVLLFNTAFAQEDFEGDDFGRSGFDFGLPQSSFADPEYVGQEKMIENMTAAYTWISQNL